MKIGMMSAWNLDAGPSIHAELIGREWVKMGHSLAVFSFISSDFHGTQFVSSDEDYVFRCFGTAGGLDPRPILRSSFNFFVAQDLCKLPKDELAKIFNHIKKKAKTINIIHDAELSRNPSFYQFDWDAIVCFDERYHKFLQEIFPEETLYTIPYPCHSTVTADKSKARHTLRLPQDKKILLIFGQRLKEDLTVLPMISEVGKHYSIHLLILSTHMPIDIEAENISLEVRRESPKVDKLYRYLQAADALILHRDTDSRAVVSSTVHLCLGSGCPIIALDSHYFDGFNEEILKYSNQEEFRKALEAILHDGEKVAALKQAAEKYVMKNSATRIAERYIKLFESLQG